ncbi:MAG: aldehyde dehydrogenase family protein [Planctomycetota bacterium]
MEPVLKKLGLSDHARLGRDGPSGRHTAVNPSTGEAIASFALDDAAAYDAAVERSAEAFKKWRETPAPERGQVVRAIGEEMRSKLDLLGEVISVEVGKIPAEGRGEVQETVDIAEYAVGLSRMIGGRTLPSERPKHRLMESWHPLGPVGVITAFNFPNAVWGWNAMVAAVCGDTVIWKPSLAAGLTAIATHDIAERIAGEMGHAGVFELIIGTDDEIGERLIADRRLPLVSATGSCRMGRRVGAVVAGRLGRCLLELGGNNAAIVEPDADLDLAAKNIVFGAVGTAGQRCTSTRRVLAHESIIDELAERMVRAYRSISIGDARAPGVLVGPLISPAAVDTFLSAVETARSQGGDVLVGGEKIEGAGNFVRPAIVRSSRPLEVSSEETFGPLTYLVPYATLDEALATQNSVTQGLSSAIFTSGLEASERFVSASGSDCGIANVNAGTSGAEIGGAFGGEKDTGGGREAGSDSWKAYMRRQTSTISHSSDMELAQGIRFE